MRRITAVVLAFFGLFVVVVSVSAQQYPKRIFTIIVPYPAGGPTDQLARIVANALQKKFGQNFVVENVTGGSTILGTNRVPKRTPGGSHTSLQQFTISD